MRKSADLKIPFSWEERRSILLGKFLYIPAAFDGHAAWQKMAWKEVFGNEWPVHMEYCSGNGSWIVERARKNPGINYVAVEKRFERARKIWVKGELPNLLVVCGEGLVFSKHYAPEDSVDEIFVNFPDPWPKLRHAKHRIVSSEFLKRLLELGKRGSKVTIVTDDSDYALEILKHFSEEEGFRPLLPSPHFTSSWDDYGASFFADLWREKGRNIHYLPYEVIR